MVDVPRGTNVAFHALLGRQCTCAVAQDGTFVPIGVNMVDS